MGLFGFGKKIKLYAPVDGTLADLTEGQTGFTIVPERHHIFSPVAGTVSELLPEEQSIKLTTSKLTVLLRINDGTGEMPATYVHEGDQVTPETPLAFVDQDQMADGESAIVTVTVDNAAEHVKKIELSTSGQVNHDQEVALVVEK